jgi:hypothetical protein
MLQAPGRSISAGNHTTQPGAAFAIGLRAGNERGEDRKRNHESHEFTRISKDEDALEPLPLDDPLLRLDNVILTPHWSAPTPDVWRATEWAMAEGMLRAARGRTREGSFNPEVLGRPAFRERLARLGENSLHPVVR